MCLAQGPQRSDVGEARTRCPSVSSQALYHWATALPHVGLYLFAGYWLKYQSSSKSLTQETNIVSSINYYFKMPVSEHCAGWSEFTVHQYCSMKLDKESLQFIYTGMESFLQGPSTYMTEICELNQNFMWDLIKFCEIFTKITYELPQNIQKAFILM